MRLTRLTGYIAGPTRTVMVLAILVLALVMVQDIALSLSYFFAESQLLSSTTQPTLTPDQRRHRRIDASGKRFLPDGTIHLMHTSREPAVDRQNQKVKIYDTADNVIWSGRRSDTPKEYLRWSASLASGGHGLHDRRLDEMRMLGPELSATVTVPVVSADRLVTERWRYEPGRGMFIGYDNHGRRFAYAGANGIKRSADGVETFEQVRQAHAGQIRHIRAGHDTASPNPVVLWQTPHRVYELNFAQRSVRVLLETPGSEIVQVGVRDWWHTGDDGEVHRPMLYVVTESRECHLLLRDPQQRRTFTVPQPWMERFLLLAATEDAVFAFRQGADVEARPQWQRYDPRREAEWLDRYAGRPLRRWVELYRINDGGHPTRVNRYDWVGPPPQVAALKQHLRWPWRTRIALSTVSPPWFFWAGRWLATDANLRDRGIRHALVTSLLRHAPAHDILTWAVVLLLTAAAFLHAWPRRTNWVSLIAWLVLVAAFNLAGLLTYLALNHTAVIRCPSCNKRRSLTRPDCPACGRPLPTPPPRDCDRLLLPSA